MRNMCIAVRLHASTWVIHIRFASKLRDQRQGKIELSPVNGHSMKRAAREKAGRRNIESDVNI